jgi:hypothetical protein
MRGHGGAQASTQTWRPAVSRHAHLRQLLPNPVTALAILLAGLLSNHSALAQMSVSGTEDGLILEAHDVALEAVLAALSARHDLHHRSTFALDRRIDGTYSGPLRRVVAHLLEGCDYVMKTESGHIEILVVGAAKRDAAPAYREAGMIPTRRRSD